LCLESFDRSLNGTSSPVQKRGSLVVTAMTLVKRVHVIPSRARRLYNSVNLGQGTLSTLILLETRGTKMKKKQKSSVPNRQSVAKASKLNPIHPNAAGIDIGAQHHWMCVPSGTANECVRRFGCYTADLYAIADWLS